MLADVSPDVLIGMPIVKRPHVSTLGFPPGAVLCLYTDGLVERRDQPIDDCIARLCAAVAAQDPEAGCAAVMAAMADVSPHSDDVALLMLRRNAGMLGTGGPDSPGHGGCWDWHGIRCSVVWAARCRDHARRDRRG